MDFKSLAAIVGGTLFLTISPVFAAGVTQTGPIEIDGANVYPTDGSPSTDNQLVGAPRSVKINFTNTAMAPATRVAFVLLSGGVIIDRTDDVGTFSKGTTISYLFPADLYRSIQQVAVAKATFADGSVWRNPNVPSERTPASIQGVAVATGY